MKRVYIYGDNDGAIRWAEDANATPTATMSTRFTDDVQFQQHPGSPKDVFVARNSPSDVYFTLDRDGGSSELKAAAVDMNPAAGQSVVLEEDPAANADGSHQGKRWHGGYVPTT